LAERGGIGEKGGPYALSVKATAALSTAVGVAPAKARNSAIMWAWSK
jgi:hypothetical protein